MNLNTQEIKRITVKSPSIPLFSKGENMVSSLWQREAGRDFQNAKVLRNLYLDYMFKSEDFLPTFSQYPNNLPSPGGRDEGEVEPY